MQPLLETDYKKYVYIKYMILIYIKIFYITTDLLSIINIYSKVWSVVKATSEDTTNLLSFFLKKDLMVLQQVQRAFTVDALVSSHPLSSKEDEVVTPGQIDELFDTITYSKVSFMCKLKITLLSSVKLQCFISC